MTALALRDDQTAWDGNQIAVLHAIGVGEDVSAGELTAFLHECQRRKLDPFIKQIYLIGRYDKQQRRKTYRSQTSIDGFRLIARRAADKAGIDYAYEDTIWFDDKGQRYEVWLSKAAPSACKVVVVRNGSRYDAVARYSEYVQTNNDNEPVGMWRSMPANQLAKCTEALALRKAFPEDLGGLYTEEEMAQADNPQTITAEVVRESPPASASAEDIWQTPPPGHDEEWVNAALERAVVFATKEDGRALWRETAQAFADRKVTPADRTQIEALITARLQDLEAAESGDVVEGVIVEGLAPEDPWHAKVESVCSPEDAEACIADINTSVKAKSLTRARADQIIAAVRAREASVVAA